MSYEDWKKQGEPYIGGLALLARLSPGHVLLPVLQKGVTPLNKLYLKGSLAKLANVPMPEKSGRNATLDERSPAPSTVHRPPSTDLESRLRLLMSERAKLRNSYHDYSLRNDVPAVQARVKINRQLMDIRKEIEDVSRKLELGELGGNFELPPNLATIPEGDEDYRELTNLRSNVARQKSKLRKAIENKLPREEVAAIELLLKQYETRRDIVAKKLKGK